MNYLFFLFFFSAAIFSAASNRPESSFEPLLKSLASNHVAVMEYNHIPCLAYPLVFIESFSHFSKKTELDDLKYAQELIENGADIEEVVRKKTILAWSISFKNKLLCNYLLSRGACLDPALKLLDLACYKEYREDIEVEKLLRNNLKEQYFIELLPLLDTVCAFNEKNIAVIITDYVQPENNKELMLIIGKKRKEFKKSEKQKNCIIS